MKPRLGYGGGELRQPGLHDQFNQRGARAERQESVQIDAAVDVERFIGVIPKPNMEQPLVLPRHHVFQGTGDDAASQEQRHRIGHVVQQQEHQQRTVTVDRADRAVQRATIHPLVLQHQVKPGLPHPADAGVAHPPQDHLFRKIQQTHTMTLRSRRAFSNTRSRNPPRTPLPRS